MSAATRTAWVTAGRTGIWTRHPWPAFGPDGTIDPLAVLDLPAPAERRLQAVHEAGHAVLALRGGIPVRHAQLTPGGTGPEGTNGHINAGPFNVDWLDYALMLAAGERASDRWLRLEGLYTPARGWVAEVTAQMDREALEESAAALSSPVTVVYGRGTDLAADRVDYADVCDDVDGCLTEPTVWRRVLAVASALDARGFLDAAALAALTGLPNEMAAAASDAA
jgi:hypothetical protein